MPVFDKVRVSPHFFKKPAINVRSAGYGLFLISGNTFNVGIGTEGEGRHIGFVAQELEREFPELVSTDEKGDKAVDYGKMTVALVDAIKEQQRQIAGLKLEINQLKAQFQPSQ